MKNFEYLQQELSKAKSAEEYFKMQKELDKDRFTEYCWNLSCCLKDCSKCRTNWLNKEIEGKL